MKASFALALAAVYLGTEAFAIPAPIRQDVSSTSAVSTEKIASIENLAKRSEHEEHLEKRQVPGIHTGGPYYGGFNDPFLWNGYSTGGPVFKRSNSQSPLLDSKLQKRSHHHRGIYGYGGGMLPGYGGGMLPGYGGGMWSGYGGVMWPHGNIHKQYIKRSEHADDIPESSEGHEPLQKRAFIERSHTHINNFNPYMGAFPGGGIDPVYGIGGYGFPPVIGMHRQYFKRSEGAADNAAAAPVLPEDHVTTSKPSLKKRTFWRSSHMKVNNFGGFGGLSHGGFPYSGLSHGGFPYSGMAYGGFPYGVGKGHWYGAY